MNESSSPPILNPNVYLNYLQPSGAAEYEAAKDIFLVSIGALGWDILSSLPGDWTLIRTTTLSPVLFAYFSSRICALVVVLMSALAKTGPVQNCGVMGLILYIFWVLASGSSSYLFLKRVHAVFLQERLIRHAFTILWLANVGASTVVLAGPLDLYYEIANTRHCTNAPFKSFMFVAFIGPVLFDNLVYIAISYKILKFHSTTKPTGWKRFCPTAESLPRVSRAVLQGGQQYYSITNAFNIMCLNWARSPPNSSPILQLVPLVPAVALTSAMACRVFRNLKLEALEKTEVGDLTTIQFAGRKPVNVQLRRSVDPTVTKVDVEQCEGG